MKNLLIIGGLAWLGYEIFVRPAAASSSTASTSGDTKTQSGSPSTIAVGEFNPSAPSPGGAELNILAPNYADEGRPTNYFFGGSISPSAAAWQFANQVNSLETCSMNPNQPGCDRSKYKPGVIIVDGPHEDPGMHQ